MPAATLSWRALNRALLARQLLLARARIPIATALERIGGLQTQYAPSGYIGLWTRLDGLQRDAVTRSLERRRVIQGTLMRSTIHMVSPRDYAHLAAGIRDARRAWWAGVARQRRIDADLAAAVAVVEGALGAGPRPRAELLAVLADHGFAKEVWEGVSAWLDMVRVPPSGTWERRRADRYALAASWIDLPDVSAVEGTARLVTAYLRGFGPAAAGDIASWAGVPVDAVHGAVAGLQLRRFRDDEGGELVDLPRAPLPEPDTAAPVRMLPTWDATLLVHARRTHILAEELRPTIFHTKNPHSVGTVLADGTVAATWRFDGSRVKVDPLVPLPPRVRRDVEAEAAVLTAFHAVG